MGIEGQARRCTLSRVGGMLQLPIWAFPIKWETLMRPDWIKPGTRVLNQWRLGPALTNDEQLDPPIKSLFVYNSNPAVVAPEQGARSFPLPEKPLD
jgi:anaerobic selenocysteine-containing dehydrogenase